MYNQYSLYHARILDIVKLCEIRKYKIQKHHMRELILFLYRYWLCCFTNDPEDAYAKMEELNQKFDIPREITIDTKSAQRIYFNKDKAYKYKNSTLIDMLDITEEEQKQLKTIIGTKEKNRRKNEHKKQVRRNGKKNGVTQKQLDIGEKVKKAKKLYEKGCIQEKIAEILNTNQSTISRYVNG